MNGKSTAKTPKEYIAALDEPVKSDIAALDKLIRKNAPTLKPFMMAGMIGYGKFHYVSKSGREGDWMYIALARQKNYISLYVCLTENGDYVAPTYQKDLPKASIGKSCIRFKKLADVDLKVMTKLIKHAAKLSKRKGVFPMAQ